jgi:hypothetical protein
MFGIITYPFDVIKTNRILQTSFSKEAGESLPREFTSLHERGGLAKGLFRGVVPTLFMFANLHEHAIRPEAQFIIGSFATIAYNPLAIMQVRKQVIFGHTLEHQPTYWEILKKTSGWNPVRLFTRGVIPTYFRNLIHVIGLAPSASGFNYFPLTVVACAGALTLAHPFEVARVIIQNENGGGMFGKSYKTLKHLFDAEGVAGLYRGYVPRMLHFLPVMLAVTEYTKPTNYYTKYAKAQLQGATEEHKE